MLDFFLVVVALILGEGKGERLAASSETPMPVSAYEVEDQTPTGRFLTATETKPILGATKANWIGVREWEGQDLIYFTQLLAWRCGLYEIRYAVNGGAMQNWPVPACDPKTATPGMIPDGAAIYTALPLKSVEKVDIELLYDDLTVDQASFERAAVLMP